MSQHTLSALFIPKSVAVIGASSKANRAGNVVMRNLLASGFSGPIMPVTPKYKAVLGVLSYANIEQLPQVPELAIICLQFQRITPVLTQLAQLGCKATVIIASGVLATDDGKKHQQQWQDIAESMGIRILGANSLA